MEQNKREIKFRAWNPKQNSDTFGITEAYMSYQGEPDIETLKSFIFHYGDCELMQFTGRKDMNGKEIYERDIVRYKKDFTDKGESWIVGDVVWDEDGQWLIRDNPFTMGIYNVIEVIGNIYETPDLITAPNVQGSDTTDGDSKQNAK